MFSMLSEKGYDLKVYNNYKFSKNKLTKKGQKWACTVKSCKTHIFTDAAEEYFIDLAHEHQHEPPAKLAREILSNSAKRKAVSDICSRPAKHVINYVIKKVKNNLQKKEFFVL